VAWHVRHHSRIWNCGQFFCFFLGQDPNHFDADLAFMRRSDELDLLMRLLQRLYQKSFACRCRPCDPRPAASHRCARRSITWRGRRMSSMRVRARGGEAALGLSTRRIARAAVQFGQSFENDVDAHRRLPCSGRAQRRICSWNHRSGASKWDIRKLTPVSCQLVQNLEDSNTWIYLHDPVLTCPSAPSTALRFFGGRRQGRTGHRNTHVTGRPVHAFGERLAA
jgi:hypothetical protein